VAVGIAAWVRYTIVKAAATAVFCISTGDMVGGAGSAPQAVSRKLSARRTGIIFLSIFSPFNYFFMS
jgi:hypothetical protein